MADDSFRGIHVRGLPRANRQFGTDRVCAAEGCDTKLSRYNKWEFCWQHEPVHTYTPRGKRKKRDATAA